MIESPESVRELPLAIIKNMITLSLSGFGVVVALAWNQVIQNFVTNYINPYFGNGSGLISLFIYATVVTVLAVIVTMQLTGIQKRLENLRARQNAVIAARRAKAHKDKK